MLYPNCEKANIYFVPSSEEQDQEEFETEEEEGMGLDSSVDVPEATGV